MAFLEINGLRKRFGPVEILKGIDLTLDKGGFLVLVGPSGCGKSTLLNTIAGLESISAGNINIDGRSINDLHPSKRDIAMVFQSYALYPNMSVAQNMAFGMEMRGVPKDERDKAVAAVAKTLQIEHLMSRRPSQLSGGQRQRVALARALAVEPQVLLLDEPFGALDATVRRELRRWLRKLHERIRVTTLFVTHDQEEALEVADRVAVMNAGKIEQFDSPEEVYQRPANPFVYGFLGNYNLFHGRHEGAARGQDEPAATFVRPHDIEILRDNADGSAIAAKVTHIAFAGAAVNVELLKLDDHQQVDAELTTQNYRELGLKTQENVFIRFRNPHSFQEDYAI
jgi:ABC-type sugar transport system ATPase subunit